LPEDVQAEYAQVRTPPTPQPFLSVQLRHRIGAQQIDVDFNVTKQWTILFGPSGSGKTTILRAIAGLLRPDSAHIVSHSQTDSVAESALTLIDTKVGVCLAAYKRGTPLAPQRATLFPHMRVLENLAFGQQRDESPERASSGNALITTLPQLFHIDGLLEKRPAELSGGEAQRVSLARAAMAGSQRMLLLDEPFSGLDLPLRDSLIANLLRWQQTSRTPILSVTHDVGEAFQLGAEVIKLADGRVVEQGPVDTVLAEERAQLLRQLNGAAASPA
jgi:molybdate transport system ATP-binding protein